MIRRFFSFLIRVVATFTLVVSFLLVYPILRFQDSGFYEQSFRKEEVELLSQSKIVIENNLDSYLKDTLKVNEDNKFSPSLAALTIKVFLRNINLEEILSEVFIKNGRYVSDWLKGDSDLYFYFPKQELLAPYNGSVGNKLFIKDFIKVAGYDELPDCSSFDQIKETDFLKRNIECGGPFLEEFITQEFESKMVRSDENIANGFWEEIAPNLSEKTHFKASDNSIFKKINLQEIPQTVGNTKQLGFLGLLLTLLFIIIVGVISLEPAKSILKIFFNTSILLIVFSLIGKVGFRIVLNFLLWSNVSLSSDVYTQDQINSIQDLLQSIFGALLDKILVEIMIIAIAVLVIVIVMYILFRFVGLITSERDYEDEYYEEEIDGDDDEGVQEEGVDIARHEVNINSNDYIFEEKILEQVPEL